MSTIANAFKHLKRTFVHKFWVARYCFAAGIPIRGLLHDMSKFSPTEFIESVRYYDDCKSPIVIAKETNGYSKAWQHHKGRNLHHYEYWQDNFDKGGTPIIMPYKYAVECVCDYLGAGRAYQQGEFSLQGEYDWWLNRIESNPIAMHPKTKEFVTEVLKNLAETGNLSELRKEKTSSIYYTICDS